MKKSEIFLLVIMGLVYVGLMGLLIPFWNIEGLSDIKVIQDFIRTIGNAQITATIGLGSLLVAIVAVAKKSQINNDFSKEFLSLLRVIMYFVFSNISIIVCSYSKFFVSSTLVIIIFFGVMGVELMLITWKTFKLGSKVLNIQ